MSAIGIKLPFSAAPVLVSFFQCPMKQSRQAVKERTFRPVPLTPEAPPAATIAGNSHLLKYLE
jgi:hypothetical protein